MNNQQMKNSKLFTLLAMLLLMSMCKDTINTATPQISKDIKESKKNGVFVTEYRVSEIFIDTNSYKLSLDIQQVWVENVWRHENYSGKIKKYETLQLVMKPSDCEMLNSFLEDWGICIDSDCTTGTGNCNIEKKVAKAEATLSLDLVKFSSKYEFNNYEKIGSIELSRR